MEGTGHSAAVLIAEDDPKTGAGSPPTRTRGYHTRTSHDGREALDVARAEAPALVVLDHLLFGADGWVVSRTLCRDPGVPILILPDRPEELAARAD
ncbi:hypothetical protein [Gemmata sp.]|uniref:hypothetical protein n=1 Tax=Gemmata sp. TaxID=1914242 RepID=UPI003F70210A